MDMAVVDHMIGHVTDLENWEWTNGEDITACSNTYTHTYIVVCTHTHY